jgi:hypothetical protein
LTLSQGKQICFQWLVDIKLSLLKKRKATRVRFGYLADGKKIRIAKKSGAIIEKPQLPVYQVKVRHKNKVDGLKDTPPQQVQQRIFLF